MIEPKKLALLFGLPAFIPQLYWRSFLARPAAELILARHALSVPGEMLKLIEEFRAIVRLEPRKALELEALWAAVATAASRSLSLRGQ